MPVQANYQDINEAAIPARDLRQQTPPDAEWVRRIGKITRAIRLAATTVDDDLYELGCKFGEKNEAGELTIKPGRLHEYNKEVRDLMRSPISLDCDPVHKSELDMAKVRFPTALDFLVLED